MTVLFFRLLSADYRTKRKYSLYRAAFLYTTDLRTVSKSPALAVHSGTMLPKHFWNVIRNFRILSCRRSVLSFRLLAWHTIWVIRLSVIQAKRPFSLFSEGKGVRLKEKQPNGEQLSPMEWEDLIHFEGNANAFRILTHQFEGRRKGGFVLTYTTLASIVKYPFSSSLAGTKSKFGFFVSEEESFRKIATELGLILLNEHPLKYARHPLVYLVEAADDICYQMMDIEDAYKLKILTTEETKELLMAYFSEERQEHLRKTFLIVNDVNEQIAYLRSSVIGLLIRECTRVFLDHEQEILSGTFEGSLIKRIAERPAAAYKHSVEVSINKIYRSRDVLDVELAGFRIISTLLELMIDAVTSPEKTYSKLLIDRVSSQYNIKAPVLYERIQAVLDYISGMTDVFALDLYRKINGNSLPAV